MSMPGEWDTAIATLSDATTIISNSSIASTSTSTSTSTKPRPSSSSSLVTTESHVYIRRKLLSRRSEFLRPNNVKIKAGTWNAGNYNCWEDIKDWFKHEEGYDVYALALQEVVDINQTANFIKYIGPTVALRWKANVQAALPEGFQCVASPQLIGMLLLVFVSPTLAHGSVSTSTVGTGLMGYVGNKGGVGVRLVLGDTLRLTFINCHLAAFANAVDRRNWDASEILRRMWFEAVEKEVVGLSPDPPANAITSTNGEGIDKTDVVIWCGDLNYRIDLENKDVRALLQPYMPADFPPAHNDAPSPKAASPPVPLPPTPTEAHPMAQTTLHGTIRSLLKHDQLLKARRAGKALADFKEGKVTFLPTYKYDVGKIGQWDSSEKARAPGWCDRILWRVKVPSSATEGPSTPTEDKRRTRSYSVASDVLAAAMRDEDEVLFETGFHDDENSGSENEDDEEDLVVSRAESPLPVYKPRNSMMSTTSRHSRNSSTDTVVYDDPSAVIATPFGDIIMEQLSYTSHQLVTSSDHKPVSATFSLTFPASVPDLRTKIHSEIAREVDKLENERRPVVTVIIDSTPSSDFVSFSPARYLLSQRRTITVANTGTTPAQLSFVATGTDNKICKPYYTLSIVDTASTPSNSSRLTTGTTLQPGDVINILITLLVANKADVIALNDKSAVLDDVLVLRIAGGRDIFIPISCTWLPCSYGTTLKELVRVPEGVGGFRGYKALPSIPDGPFYSAPREIYKITQFLCDGLADVVSTLWPDEKIEDKRWFSQLGWPFLESTWGYKDPERRRKVEIGVWEALDTDGEFEDVKTLRVAMDEEDEMVHKEELVEVAAEVVVKWLAGLTDGVIPEEMWDEVVKAGGEAKAAEQVLDHLPLKAAQVHANVFVYLAGFLAEALSILVKKKEFDRKKEMDKILNRIIDPISRALVRRPAGRKVIAKEDEARRAWVKRFVEIFSSDMSKHGRGWCRRPPKPKRHSIAIDLGGGHSVTLAVPVPHIHLSKVPSKLHTHLHIPSKLHIPKRATSLFSKKSKKEKKERRNKTMSMYDPPINSSLEWKGCGKEYGEPSSAGTSVRSSVYSTRSLGSVGSFGSARTARMIEKETEGETERPETAWRVSGSTKIGGSGGPGASAYSITSINNNPFLIPGDVHGSNTSINSNPFRSSVHSAAFRTPMPIPSIRNSLTIDGSSAANSRNSRHWNNNTNYEPSISDRSFMSTATIASVSTAHSRSASGSSATSFGTELMSVVDTLSSSVYEVPEGYKRQEVVRRGSSYSNPNLDKRSLPPTPVGSKEEKRSLPPIPPAALLGSPGPEYVDKKRSLPPTPTGQGMQFNGISYMKEDSDSGMEYGYADSIYSINSSALDALSVIDPLDPMDPLEGDVTPRGSPRGSISGASLRSEAHPGWRSYASSLQSYSSSLSASANGKSGMEFAPSIRGGSQYSGSLYSRRSDASSVRTGSSDSRYSGVSVEFAGQPGFVDSRPGSVSGASLASEGFGVYGGDYDEEYEDDGDYGYAQSVSSSVLSGLSVISPGVTPRGSISGGYQGVRNGSGAAMGSYSDAGSSVHSGSGGASHSGYAGSTRVGNGEGGSTTEGNYASSMRSANSSSTNGKKHTRNLSTMSANSFATALTAASFFDTAADFDPVVGTGLELVSPPATPRASMQSARRNTSVSGASVADYAATRNSHNARGFGNALNATKIVQDYKSPFDPRGASSGVETERDPTTPKPPSRSSTSTATNAGYTTVTTNENHSRQPTAPASNHPAGSQKKHNRTISNMSAKTFATTLTSNSFFSICTSEAEAEAAFAQLFQPNDSTTPRASIELEANPSRQIAELYSPVTPRASLNKSRSNHDFGGILTDYGMLKADAKIGGKIGAGGVSGTWHGRTSSNVTDMTVDSFSTAKAAESRPSTAVNLSVSNPAHKRELSDSSNITITAPQTRNNSTATARTTSTFSSVTSSTRGTISTSGGYSTRGNSLDVGRAPNQTATLDVPPGSLSVRTASSTTLGQQKPDGLPVPPTSQGPLFRGLRSHKSFSSLRRPSSSRSVTPSVTPSITPSITITNTVPSSPPPASSRPPSRGLGIPGLRSSSRPPASPSPSNSTSSSLASPAAVSPTTPGRGRKDKDTNRARGPPPVARSPYQQTTRTSIQICGAEEGNYRRFPLTAGMLYSGTPTSSIYSGSARESFQTYRSMGGESVHSVQSGMTGTTGRSGVSGVSAQKKGLQGAGHVVKELFWKGGWKKKER